MVKIKICGITNMEDATLACYLGADALGFIFYEKSPRYLEPEKVGKILAALPPFVTKVGVFVNMPVDDLNHICASLPLNLAQLHGDESPEFCKKVNLPCIKAFRINNNTKLMDIKKFKAAAYLLDTFHKKRYGGTGQTFDWNLATEVNKFCKIILSGGLNPENISRALNFVHPYAVDVSSGVEAYPGKKDPDKLKSFFQEVQKYTQFKLKTDREENEFLL